MKLLFLVGCLLLVQSSFCDDGVTTKKCEDFLPADTCNNLRNVASVLKEKSSIVADAVKSAIQHHKTKAQEMLAYIKQYMTERITCENIFTATACQNMETAIQKFHEQRKLLQEAIFSAAEKHFNNVKEFLGNVQKTLIDKAVNFKCTDVLSQQQCDKLTSYAQKFKLKTGEVQVFLKEFVINGTATAKQIYDKTIGAILNHLDHVTCEDLISASACTKLTTLASNLKETAADVKLAVATAITNGVTKTSEIVNQASEFLKEIFSCENVFGSICQKLRSFSTLLHVSFQKVIVKIRDLYASGVKSATEMFKKVYAYIWSLYKGTTSKRSLDTSSFVDLIMKQIEKLTAIGKDVKEKLIAQLKQLKAQGKVTFLNVKKYIKELIAKYGPQSDDSFDAGVGKSIIEQLKEALKKAHGKAKELLKKLLTKSKEQLEKLKEVIKTLLGNQEDHSDVAQMTYDIIADVAHQELDEELKKTSDEVDKMM